jgi:hypothetical protein
MRRKNEIQSQSITMRESIRLNEKYFIMGSKKGASTQGSVKDRLGRKEQSCFGE